MPIQKKAIKGIPVFDEFSKELAKDVPRLPPIRNIEFPTNFELETSLVHNAESRMVLLELKELKAHLQELLYKGFIRSSSSPQKHLYYLSLRMCIDYWELNKVTIKNKYPLPRIDNLPDQLQRVTAFSKLNLESEYHQLMVKESEGSKTNFRLRYEHYEFTMISFGQANFLTTLMDIINQVFRPFLDMFLVVFINDILVYSQNLEGYTINPPIISIG